MDNALVCGTKDCRLESCQSQAQHADAAPRTCTCVRRLLVCVMRLYRYVHSMHIILSKYAHVSICQCIHTYVYKLLNKTYIYIHIYSCKYCSRYILLYLYIYDWNINIFIYIHIYVNKKIYIYIYMYLYTRIAGVLASGQRCGSCEACSDYQLARWPNG